MENKGYIVIPDIHERHHELHAIVAKYPEVPHRIFLGDWFDSFETPEDPARAIACAHLIRDLAQDPRNTLLLGNHDVSYRWGGQFTCAGYQPNKHEVIRAILGEDDWHRFRVHVRVGKWLLSHAGFHAFAAHPVRGLADHYLESSAGEALDWAAQGRVHPWFGAGASRGGPQAVGGPLWLDWDDEFAPVQGLNQIVGHSEHRRVQRKGGEQSENWCLDTQLRAVALIDDGAIEVIEM